MKKIFFVILLAAAATACRKDSSGSAKGKMLLSKIFVNDLLSNEFIYDLDGKLSRINLYVTGGGVSSLAGYYLHQYDSDGRLSERIQYSSDHAPLRRQVYTYSDQGRLSRVDEASASVAEADLDIMDFYWTYNYDVKGQLETIYNYKSNYVYINHKKYIYDNQGLWQGWEYYIYEDSDYQLKEKFEFSPGGKPIPDHWKHFLVVPSDFNLFRLFVPGFKVTSYWGGPTGSDLIYAFENREYNSQGYVTREVMKVTSTTDFSESERRFEYVQ